MLTVGSLFSGVGGLDLGLARAGWTAAFFAESDPYRRRVLRRHWPRVPVYEDVRVVGRTDGRPTRGRNRHAAHRNHGRGSHPGVDLLCGGFPCQDLSVAGRRAGLTGERSGLFFEFARVADALLSDGGWLLIENVPGLLSSNGGRDFAVVLATLAELGFHDLAWRVLDSRYFGVPQRRRRVFIVGRRASGRRACEVLLEPESGGGDSEASREARTGVAGSVADGAQSARSLTSSERWDGETEDFVAATLQASGGHGDSRRGHRIDSEGAAGNHLVAHTLRSEGFDASEDGTGRGTPLTVDRVRLDSGPIPGRREPDREGRQQPRDSVPSSDSGGGDGPPVDPDGVRTPPSDAGRLDDSAGAEPRAFMPYRTLEKDGSVTGGFAEREVVDALHGPTGNKEPLVMGGVQGRATPLDPKPDGPRYAACGDAVTASVAEWIGRRIIEAEAREAA